MSVPYRSFEDCIETIDKEINKRRGTWKLTALAWLSFDDVANIIRAHINVKWHLYDQTRPLNHWLSKVISSQIINISRNNYKSLSRPCLSCPLADGESGCLEYGSQCVACPLYKKWSETKRHAFNIKLPLTVEHHQNEVVSIPVEHVDVEKSQLELNIKLKELLKPNEWIIYKIFYIDNLDEDKALEKAAAALKLKTTEKTRVPGYKQIYNIKNVVIQKAKKLIYSDDMDIHGY